MKVGELEPIFGRTHTDDKDNEARYIVVITNTDGKPYTTIISEGKYCGICDTGYKIELTESLLLQILILFPPLDINTSNVSERQEKLISFLKRVAEGQGLI